MLNCQPEFAANLGELNVGLRFNLVCQGEASSLGKDLKLIVPEADQFKLRLLDAQFVSKDQLILNVTSYSAGQHKLKELKLSDGVQEIPLNEVQFEVKSVIDPQAPPEQPYGPMA